MLAVPLVRSIYGAVKDLIGLFGQQTARRCRWSR